MMKQLAILLTCLLFVGVQFSQAQTVRITGTVTSSEDGMPLPGVSVIVKGTTIGGATDANGKYEINVPTNAQALTVSFIGYVAQEQAIAGRSVIDFVLSPETQQIEEVVVTGYGVVKKSAFTGASSTMDEKSLQKKFNTNPIKALEGSVTGLQMSTGSGQPGAPATIFIRGRNSLNSGTQPLYIIDGVPFTAGAQGMRASEGQTFSPLASINPDDIESMTVLKDATATSIYGARAANGVIVITTKQGKKGVFKVNVSARVGFEAMPIIPKSYRLLDADKHIELATEAALNEYNDFYTGVIGSSYTHYYNENYFGLPYTTEGMTEMLYGWNSGTKVGADVNWLDEVTRTGKIQQYSIDVSSGGTEENSIKYYLSLDYLDNQGIVIGKDMKRYSLRLNVEQSPSKFITYGFNTNVSNTEINMGAGGGYFSDPITQAYMQSPLTPVKTDLGKWNFGTINGYNPVAQRSSLGDKSNSKQNRFLFSPHVRMNFTPDLFFVSRVGLDAYLTDEFGYWSFLQPQGKDMRGMGENSNSTNILLSNTNTLNYLKTFNEVHNVNVLVGQEAQKNNTKFAYLSGSNYAVDYLNDVSLTAIPGSASTSREQLIIQSFFGNAQYDYANKYYLSGSFRVDGSSRFGSDKYWAKFWSVGAKYRISAESFMQSTQDWLRNLVVRASYGTTGNQTVGDSWYAARDLYDFGYNYNQKPGSAHLRFGNPNLTWEYTSKFNVGVDFNLLDRFWVTADYYKHNTKDMVFNVPVTMTSGLSSYYKNIGELENTGFEASVTAAIVKQNDLNWSVTINGSHNKNEIVKLSNSNPIEGTYTIVEKGRDIYTFKMKEWAGVDPATGRGMWYLNETGDETTFNYNAAAKRYVGTASPKFQGSFNSNLSWKGFEFSFLLTTSLGGKIYGNSLRYDEQQGGSWGENQTQWVYDNRWQEPGDIAEVPKLYAFRTVGKETSHSSRYLMNGNYLKIRTITLAYNLPENLIKKAYAKNVRVFVNVENLYTFSHKDFRGFDPSAIDANGVQWWNYPVPRTFIFGINVGF